MSPARDPVVNALESHRETHPGTDPGPDASPSPSVFLWGSSPPVVNLVLYALARRMDPEFVWVNVRDHGAPDPFDELLESGRSKVRTESVAIPPDGLRPNPPMRARSLASLVLLDDAPHDIDRLQRFMALPVTAQEIAARSVPTSGARVLAIPNIDRVSHLYAGQPETAGRVLQALREISVSLMIARGDGPGPLRALCDYVFEVRAHDLASWERGVLVAERSASPEILTVGRALPLADLAWANDVLTAATVRARRLGANFPGPA